jgi:hypothetical protein
MTVDIAACGWQGRTADKKQQRLTNPTTEIVVNGIQQINAVYLKTKNVSNVFIRSSALPSAGNSPPNAAPGAFELSSAASETQSHLDKKKRRKPRNFRKRTSARHLA